MSLSAEEQENARSRYTRLDLLKRGAALAGGLALGSLAAACGGEEGGGEGPPPAPAEAPPPESAEAATFTGPLRLTGIFVPDPASKERAERALGFELATEESFIGIAGATRALADPASFDVLNATYHVFKRIWPSGNLVGIDRTKITRWGEVEDLFKLGKLAPGDPSCSVGVGHAPFRTLYTTGVEEPGEIVQWGADGGSGAADGAHEPPGLTAAPFVFGVDSIGYNSDVVKLEPTELSWGELLNQRWKGRVAVFDEPTAGWLELGLAARALGLMEFRDLGNMTKEEMDGLAAILLELKRQGHFRAFWQSPEESFNLMTSGEVVIESMWPITAQALVAQQLPFRLAAPVEGFRGWATGNAVSSEAAKDPGRLQACYDYINYLYSQGAGEHFALTMRLGFYVPLPERSRAFFEPGEYAYWIEGTSADKDYPGPLGEVSIRKGQVREGGSLAERACKYGAWNAIFDESEHQLRRWEEIVSA